MGICINCSEKIADGEDCLVIGTDTDTLRICKACAFKNPTFQRLATEYAMWKIQTELGGKKHEI